MSSIQIVFRPRFFLNTVACSRQDESFAASEAVLARWRSFFPMLPQTESADFEDFHENAAALIAAVDSGEPVFVMERGTPVAGWLRVAASFNTDAAEPQPGVPTILIGALLKHDPLAESLSIAWPNSAGLKAANDYYRNPAFVQFAGRQVAVATSPDRGEPGYGTEMTLIPTIRRIAEICGPALLLKIVNLGKYANVFPIDITTPCNDAEIQAVLIEALDYHLVHIEGEIPRFLVQERIRIENEYRVIVIDGKPVAGAACIDAMSPPYNHDGPFDTLVEGMRGSGCYARDPELVGRYIRVADEAAKALKVGDPAFSDATLDFGVKPDGDVVMIEANPLSNFGLYALDYHHVMDAAIQAVRDRELERDRSVVFKLRL